ncbi:Multifunctional conjugation protein TraI [Posidoniimonas corsicana]|uniref:Multifunctional conjugation protein TraI n=1 Tax=Posidoniimonas corsicana TaxID=1938618 RepID=A0A5C5VBX3_9BACT|nr:MobF family relaxase [Posidoniimonas corsicana]TWT35222.1 Multifunctional conjugation protein TraI [Posidoniimonas corsicana]
MLRIVQNRSAASAKSYYSHAEYYGESQEMPGRWGGKAAKLLGLEGTVDQPSFDMLCDNLDPRTGDPLTARTNHDRTVGYDFNFHVPKGLSLAYAFGDERIGRVFEESVEATMREIEQESKTRVRTSGKQEDRVTGNLVWGTFVHKTARPIEGEPDPHLHAHCFVFNATLDPVENRFKAAQFRDLKRDAGYFEARFHARLARRVKDELGYDLRRTGRQWDIAAIPAELAKKFSRRTAQIEDLAQERGITSADQKSELAAVTRESKTKHQTVDELRQSWRARLTDEEAQLIDALPSTLQPDGGSAVDAGPANTAAAVRQAIHHCFERDAVVPERKLLAEALRVGVGQIDADDVEQEAFRQHVLAREIDGRRMATTAEVLAEEQAVIDYARRCRGAVRPLNDAWQVSEENAWLSDEQRSAIRQLAHSPDRVQLLLGGAGVGKTTLMTEAVRAINDGGRQVFTFAPSAEASRGVLRSEGFETATTVAELLLNEKLHDQVRGQVLWVDEAGLLGSRQLKRLFDLADGLDCRVILSGDWKRQHGSVERGGVLPLLDRYAGVTPIEVRTIRRQEGAYKAAIAAMSAGDLASGFDQLDKLGWVRELDPKSMDQQIAADYAELTKAGKSALVVSPTHRQAAHVTAAIRARLREQGALKSDDRELLKLEPLHLTEAEKSDPAFLEEGAVLVFHQNARGYQKGDRVVVHGSVDPEITSQSSRYSVYRASSLPVASGDQIRLTAGGRTKDGEHRLNNGATFEVAGVLPSGDLKLANGWIIDRSFGHLAHGYVTTSHASQGRTVDHVLIAESAESFPAASSEQFYVSASRGRRSVRIYTDDKAELRDVVQASSANTTASEVMFGPDPHYDRHRKQREASHTPSLAPVVTPTHEPTYAR